jgi:hypothetical protein
MYCLGRPYTMPGGALHWPIWAPYKLFPSLVLVDSRYGEVDYIYGIKAYENHNGFTNAQSLLNVFELLLQIWFLQLRKRRNFEGKALMVGYTVSVMTLSKTVLYWLQEYYSGYCYWGCRLMVGMRRLDIIVGNDWYCCGLYRMGPGLFSRPF